MYKIFLVEDDETIAAAVARHIEAWGWEAVRCRDFTNVTGEFAACNPHLVLLDIGLPYRNGYHWCAELRKLSRAPIIFLSSAADNMNIVMAMEMGGDDFIAKPFDLEVLSAGPTTSAPPRPCWSAGAQCWTPGTTPSAMRGSGWS